jgi:hypothetical protein
MFAARLLLGEFVTGYEVSGWYGVGAPKGRPGAINDELNKEIQGIIDRNCAWHFVTSQRRYAEVDWRCSPACAGAIPPASRRKSRHVNVNRRRYNFMTCPGEFSSLALTIGPRR